MLHHIALSISDQIDLQEFLQEFLEKKVPKAEAETYKLIAEASTSGCATQIAYDMYAAGYVNGFEFPNSSTVVIANFDENGNAEEFMIVPDRSLQEVQAWVDEYRKELEDSETTLQEREINTIGKEHSFVDGNGDIRKITVGEWVEFDGEQWNIVAFTPSALYLYNGSEGIEVPFDEITTLVTDS